MEGEVYARTLQRRLCKIFAGARMESIQFAHGTWADAVSRNQVSWMGLFSTPDDWFSIASTEFIRDLLHGGFEIVDCREHDVRIADFEVKKRHT